MNTKKKLEKNQTLLLVMSSVEYQEEATNIAKQLSEENVCYVTINKTYEALRELFEKRGVHLENIVFVDAITSTFKKPSKNEGVEFISSPHSLSELSVAINRFLITGFQYLIFDSITNLMVYEPRDTVIKFLQFLNNKIRSSEIKAVFYALDIKEYEDVIEECGMFIDKIIEV